MNWEDVVRLIRQGDLDAAFEVFDALCAARGWHPRGDPRDCMARMYDADDFDADELGLDPERDFDA